MIVEYVSNHNRWRIFKNKKSNDLEVHYEGWCPVANTWVTIGSLSINRCLLDNIKLLYK